MHPENRVLFLSFELLNLSVFTKARVYFLIFNFDF